MSIDHSDFTIVKQFDKASTRSDEGPEESMTFVFRRMGDDTFDDIAVDPNTPNAPAGRTDGLFTVILPSIPHTGDANAVFCDGSVRGGDDQWTVIVVTDHGHGLLLPAVQGTDIGLLLPAVRVDGGEASITDGTSNTFMFGAVVPSPHTGGVNAVLCDGSVRPLNNNITPDYNPYVTMDYLL